MFTTHFKMSRQPFAERMPLDQIQRDDRINQGLARLEYLAENETIGLVTGMTGVGKSSLIKLFLASLARHRFRTLYLHLTHLPANGFLKLLVEALGEIPKRGQERVLRQILEKCRESDATPFLVVDEAQLLDHDALTSLRLLVSSAIDDAPPFKLLLVGQESFRKKLKESSLAPLLHRIAVRYHLHPLSREQTASYIDFQIEAAGASHRLFGEDVKSLIYDYTGGLPRQINNLATTCLIHAASQKTATITEELFQQTLADFTLP